MDTKVAQVAQAMIDSLQNAKEMDTSIDSTDRSPREVSGDAQAFTMTKDIVRGPGLRARTIGRIVYTVTVTATYMSQDDEEE